MLACLVIILRKWCNICPILLKITLTFTNITNKWLTSKPEHSEEKHTHPAAHTHKLTHINNPLATAISSHGAIGHAVLHIAPCAVAIAQSLYLCAVHESLSQHFIPLTSLPARSLVALHPGFGDISLNTCLEDPTANQYGGICQHSPEKQLTMAPASILHPWNQLNPLHLEFKDCTRTKPMLSSIWCQRCLE